MKKNSSKIGIALILALTLGLAPFLPEPHIWGKLKWIFGGGVGMKAMDYFDLILHGFPWVYLIVVLVQAIRQEMTFK